MQRYEREVQEILRSLGCEFAPDPPDDDSRPASDKRAAEARRIYSVAATRPGASTSSEKFVGSACLLLAVAFLVLGLVPLLAAVIIVLTIVLLLVSLRQQNLAARRGELADKDLRWIDVTAQAKPRVPGTPHNPDDSLFWYK